LYIIIIIIYLLIIIIIIISIKEKKLKNCTLKGKSREGERESAYLFTLVLKLASPFAPKIAAAAAATTLGTETPIQPLRTRFLCSVMNSRV